MCGKFLEHKKTEGQPYSYTMVKGSSLATLPSLTFSWKYLIKFYEASYQFWEKGVDEEDPWNITQNFLSVKQKIPTRYLEVSGDILLSSLCQYKMYLCSCDIKEAWINGHTSPSRNTIFISMHLQMQLLNEVWSNCDIHWGDSAETD